MVSPTLPVLGLTETVPMTGSVFSTVAEAVPLSEPLSGSVAVAVQVRVSPGSSLELMVYVAPVLPSFQV